MAKQKKIRVKMMVQGTMFNEVFDNEKDAETFRELLDLLKVGRFPANQHVKKFSVAKVWCEVIEDKKEDGLDKDTINNTLGPVLHFQDFMKRDISGVTPEEWVKRLESLTNLRTGAKLSIGTLERFAVVIKQVLEKAVELGVTGINPKRVSRKLLKAARSYGLPEKTCTAFTPEEIEQWMNSPEEDEPWVRLFARAALASFKRISELLALGWADIDFDKRQILINKMVTGGRFKYGLKAGRPAHYIEMNDELYEVFMSLKKYQKENGIDSDWVFHLVGYQKAREYPPEQGCPYRGRHIGRCSLVRRVKSDMKRAGLVPKKIHDLRRTAASIFFLESPLPYKETMLMLQKKLNHASLSSTEKYISISSEFLAMKMQKAQDERRIKELEAQTKVLELQAKIRELEDQLRSVA